MRPDKDTGTAHWSGDVKSVCAAAGVDPESGLSTAEAKRRLRKYGANRIYAENRESALRYIGYVSSDLTLILLLITAAVASVFGERTAAALIIPILIFSILLRTYAYIRARRYLEACSSASAVMPSVAVLRGGAVYRVDLRNVAVGDIIRLRPGDIVPCDCRLISASSLSVYDIAAEASSGPVRKYPCELPADTAPAACANICFAGSCVYTGYATAIAVEIGANTYAVRAHGGIQGGIQSGKQRGIRSGELGITRSLERYSRIWGAFMTAAVFIITVLQLIIDGGGLYGVFFSGLALAVASMCEYYSAIGDITAAAGLSMLSRGGGGWRRYGAFMRTMKSIDILSQLDTVIFGCDGVITTDGLECEYLYYRGHAVGGIQGGIQGDKQRDDDETVDFDGNIRDSKYHSELCRIAAIASGIDGQLQSGADGENLGIISETAVVINEYFIKNDIKTESLYGGMTPILFTGAKNGAENGVRFDTRLVSGDDGYTAYMCGYAREIIAAASALETERSDTSSVTRTVMSSETRAGLLSAVAYYERRGAAVIGVAMKNTPFHSADKIMFTQQDVTFIGLMAFLRPLAPDADGAVQVCRRAGIHLIMTGDGRAAALTAQRVGIISGRQDILTEREFIAMSEDEKSGAAKSKSLLIGFGCKSLHKFISLTGDGGRRTAYVGNSTHDIPSEIRLLHCVGASFALSHENMYGGSGSAERMLSDETRGVSQTLKLQADNIIPRATERGGGLPCIIDSAAYAKRIFRNIDDIAKYLITSQTARFFCVLYSILTKGALLSADKILLWGLIFDFFAVITLALERPDYTTLSYKPDLYKKLSHPLSGIKLPFVTGLLWAALTMITPVILRSESDETVIFISVMLSVLAVCGEIRSDYSVFSWRRRINTVSMIFIALTLILIILITVSPSVSGLFITAQPDAVTLLSSVIPAAVLLAVSEFRRALGSEGEGMAERE